MSVELAGAAEPQLQDAALQKWKRYAFALLLVGAAVVSSAAWTQLIGAHNLALPFMSALMVAGGWLGLRPALVAAIPAFLAHNLLFATHPFGLTLTGPDLLIFTIFVATAVLVGGLAARLSERARMATRRLRRLAALSSASRDLSAAATPGEVARKLVRHLETEFGAIAAVWSSAPGEPLLAASESARETASAVRSPVQAGPISGTGDRWTTLATARGAVGAVALWLGDRPIGTGELHAIEALLELGAIALDRATLAAEVSAVKLAAAEGQRAAEPADLDAAA